MKKKLLGLLLSAVMVAGLAGCGSAAATSTSGTADAAEASTEGSAVKVGVILVGDETESYTKAHIDGIKEAASEDGIPESNIVWK
ncbi:MAG: BMP family ABC transporter substrate-binding protein, partial [Eubacterium sp.]|nr:BMP family ABC transporter substrate-binding protein [Eubacterium sp.]